MSIPLAAIARELERELRQRRDLYPARIEGGNMLAVDAERQIALAAAWAADIARLLANPIGAPPAALHEISWWSRREALLRELAMREQVYPRHIAEGRLLKADADHRTACLRALLALYEDGELYEALNGARPRAPSYGRTEAQAEARREWLNMQLKLATDRALPDRIDTMRRALFLEDLEAGNS